MTFRKFIGITLSFAANCLFAQDRTTSHDNQQWLQYYSEAQINTDWTLLNDISFRWKDGFNENSQFLIRTGIGYSLNQNLRLAGGFAYIGFYSKNHLNLVEYRPHQELLFKTTFSKIKLNQRLRIEERFFNPLNKVGIPQENTFNMRFRYSVSVSLPICNLSKNNPYSKFSITIGDELFINVGNNIGHTIFNQNRFTISPTFQLNKNILLAPTWNNRYAATTTQGLYKHTQVFWLQVRHSIDLSDN
ncbi:DUF2490 domain-containing protein [Flavobacteriaceae bacterium XHP0103]|uniref:DUF2490 domain-containing protein n=1 Tax=Marixanthotalea marina TaxID=2844359 RepID=UPI002989B818|nr:DUF2490 domain-containing protein [Marixanthotalea marina]MBU3822871.1 DUF2490 domain-containing protein [Marixanthotalea marina]